MLQRPTTELEAVNLMLAAINEPPVNSIEETEGTESALAVSILAESSRRIQQDGCSFNREYLELLPDPDGTIHLPANTLKATAATPRYIERGRRIYDRYEGTFRIGEAVPVELVRCLAFSDLPEAARYYIAVTAARKFASRTVGSTELVGLSERDEAEARQGFLEYELEQNRPNLFSSLDRAVIARNLSLHDFGGTSCR